MKRSTLVVILVVLGLLAVAAVVAPSLLRRQGGAVEVIRIGAPVVTGSTSTQTYFGAVGVARVKRLFEREFEADGIRVEFVGFPNGPMVAQALANNQIDFAGHGDMISIIARASGARTRLIMPSQRFANAYVVVPEDSPVRQLGDLRGKRVAYAKGNFIHLQALRILQEHDLGEGDIRSVSLSPSAATAALRAGQIDAVIANADILLLVNQGVGRVVYDTRERPELGARSAIVVREDFAAAHPVLTTRVVKVLVQAGRYASEEQRREGALGIWGTGRAVEPLRAEYEGAPMRDAVSPLLDPFIVEGYRRTQEDVAALGFLRGRTFDIETWFDRTYLDHALKSLGLETYWTARDAANRPIPPGAGQ